MLRFSPARCTLCNWKWKTPECRECSHFENHIWSFRTCRWISKTSDEPTQHRRALSDLANTPRDEWAWASGEGGIRVKRAAVRGRRVLICGQLRRDDFHPEASAIFLRQGNLSCSDCHINWFCLTEPDLQHFQDVNFSLWLWRTQVWLPITADRSVLFSELIHIFWGRFSRRRRGKWKIMCCNIDKSQTFNFSWQDVYDLPFVWPVIIVRVFCSDFVTKWRWQCWALASSVRVVCRGARTSTSRLLVFCTVATSITEYWGQLWSNWMSVAWSALISSSKGK